MFNQSGIKTTVGAAPNQILFNTEFQFSVGVVVAQGSTTADSEGRKIIKAGTPLTGSLDARTTAFAEATTTGGVSNAVGVLLHDVDVTAGNANGTLLIFGFVNTKMVDTTTKAKITSAVKTALNAKVTFIEG